jgi:serine/threonine protein kinase
MPGPQPAIPGYEILRTLGVNLGTVYLARHVASGTTVALAVWRLEFADHARDVYGSLARLGHPSIIRVLETGEFQGSYFYSLEYFERSLADRLREGPLPDAAAARIARHASSAVQHALKRGITPLSLSARSIGLTDEGLPKLTEFGPIGSFEMPTFLSHAAGIPPEWVSGASTDTASEASQVYRLGVLLYEMLTTKLPFAADEILATLARILREMPDCPRTVNPKVSQDLDAVCMKCLMKDPGARYASLQDLVDHLDRLESR